MIEITGMYGVPCRKTNQSDYDKLVEKYALLNLGLGIGCPTNLLRIHFAERSWLKKIELTN